MPVVVVMGARQTGKSTLVRTDPVVGERPYITLDDIDLLVQARTEPDDLVRRAPRLTIDEVQREADLVLAIKRVVDETRPRRPGRFVLTGSANLLLMKRVAETLAGRASYVSLWPLTRRERMGLGTAGIWSELLSTPATEWYDLVRAQEVPSEDWRALARTGGYPTPAYELSSEEGRSVWFRGYVKTYLERDLQDLSAIENLVDFRRLMRAACLRIGAVVNQADIARDTGISRPTLHRYLNLLETSFQAVRIEPYSVNRTKRLVKSPKLYWSDTGLAMHLAGEENARGEHLENLVLNDLAAWRDAQTNEPQVLFWRTHEGEEVDFVIEAGDRLLPIEVKAAARVTSSDARHLRTFRDQYGEMVHGGLLLHTGEDVFWVAEGILAAPWWRIL
jgi:predicted AAA+ superfamily ATPase